MNLIFFGILFLSVLVVFLFWLRHELKSSFKALSLDALEQSAKSLAELAEAKLDGKGKAIDATLAPVKEALKNLEERQRELEQKREGAYASLYKQIDQMIESDRQLRKETAQLAASLKLPQQRGSWGQVHLRRVVELAGLLNQCDFSEQQTTQFEGRVFRPDLIVKLPGDRQIAIDAKTPLDAYLEASQIEDEEKKRGKLAEHALALRKHIKDLSSKEYWKSLEISPDYVILFLPAESFFSAAIQVDPTLIEIGADQNIVIATPTTLIAILRAIAFSWKQDGFSKNAKEIAKIGSDLYERIGTLTEHWTKLGKLLGNSVDTYNQSIASLESRVLVSARKLKEIGGMPKEIALPDVVEKIVKG